MLQNYKEILDKSRNRVLELGDDVLKSYDIAIDAFTKSDIQKANEARKMLKNAHEKGNKIDNEIIKTLALFSPEAKDLRVVIAHLKITSELTRISDYIRSYAKNVKIQISGEFELEGLRDDTISFLNSSKKSLEAAIGSIKSDSEDELEKLYHKVNVEESKCDDIHSILEKNVVQQICVMPESAGDFILFLKYLRKIERISDRSVDIVKLSYFAQKGGKLKL